MTTLIANINAKYPTPEEIYTIIVNQIVNLPLATSYEIGDRAFVQGVSGTEESSIWINMLNEQPFQSGNFIKVWANLTTGQTELGS